MNDIELCMEPKFNTFITLNSMFLSVDMFVNKKLSMTSRIIVPASTLYVLFPRALSLLTPNL